MLVLGLKFLMYGHAVYIPFHLTYKEQQQKIILFKIQKELKTFF